MKRTMTFAIILLSLSFTASAAVIHVPSGQPTIQAGIDAASNGDTVLVANGTYTGYGNRDLDFHGKTITVKSQHGAEYCIIDCQGSSSDPHRGFTFHSGEGHDAVVQGFTIRNGYVNDSGGAINCNTNPGPTIIYNIISGNRSNNGGGGINCLVSSPVIQNNTVINNETTTWGGGIICNNSSAVFMDNTISGNMAGMGAGGLSCYASTLTITGNVFSENWCNTHSGGAILSNGNSKLKVSNNTFHKNRAPSSTGGGICSEQSEALIANNTFTENESNKGGGIACNNSPAIIVNNLISQNVTGSGGGGGIDFLFSSPLIQGNTIVGNTTSSWGGGLTTNSTTGIIKDNIISGNVADLAGGGLGCYADTLTIANNLIENNIANNHGGAGMLVNGNSHVTLTNNTFRENEAFTFVGGGLRNDSSTISIKNCIFWADSPDEISGGATVTYSDVMGGYPGTGNINADPLFVSGPHGDFYLSQVAAGQGADSPCVNTGDPASDLYWGSTRTDHMLDTGVIDMGYHCRGLHRVIVGPGRGYDNPPVVRIFTPRQDAGYEIEIDAYGPSHYGVNVACGKLDSDGPDEILTGAGPGAIYGPHVRGFEHDGPPLPGLNFLAYGTQKYGVNVAAGDLDGDGFDEIITGAGPGAVFGPHVRGWNYDGGPSVTSMPGVSYFAYGTPKWGVNVAAGDIDGDGVDEIVTGPGPGAVYGPHVRGWNVVGGNASAMSNVSFFAYGTLKYGVNVGCGDVDGDGIDEIVTGPGPGSVFGAHVRGFEGNGTPLPGFSFFAWPTEEIRFGAKVAAADLDDDGMDEIIVGCGPDPLADTTVKVYSYDGTQINLWFSLEAFPGLTEGATVAAGRF